MLREVKAFKERDLNLQVRLDTCADGEAIDFTGKKSYNFGLMKEGVGFGITDIDIDINASLQPIIEITFKDLYGNTLFGTQRVGGSLRDPKTGAFNKSTEIDYSVLFNWPPPKFYFTFKGYLGEPVTWILNLKKSSTSFNSSDGSFGTKVTFVPNQWGFFADMPFLYLLAVKSLKKDDGEELENINTLYDLIKIGKKIEVKKNETSKSFDLLLNQVSAYQSNLAGAIEISRIIKYDTPVTGVVNGESVPNFRSFNVVRPNLTDSETLSLTNGAENLERFTSFLVTKCTIIAGSSGSFNTADTAKIKLLGPSDVANHKTGESKGEFNKKMKLMADNREAVELAIQRTAVESTQTELGQLTISNIFSKLAGDGAYILGRILEAGYGVFDSRGENDVITTELASSSANPETVSATKKELAANRNENPYLIGKYFPMAINDDGQEVPATVDEVDIFVGVEEFEMKFVDQFIRAIADGIIENRLQSSQLSSGQDDKLKKRVSNAEITQGNPYSSSYENIASNILERSGVVSFITRGYDPNRPGNYGNTTYFQNDSKNEIIRLAEADMENISEGIIQGMFDEDITKLKRFCLFFKNLFDSNGDIFESTNGKKSETASDPDLKGFGEPVDDSVNVTVSTLDASGEEGDVDVFTFFNTDVQDLLLYSQTSDSINEIGDGFTSTYQMDRMLNNGVPYLIFSEDESDDNNSNNDENDDLIYMIRFQGEDITRASSSNSAESDYDTDEGQHDDPDGVQDAEEPLGLVKITSVNDDDGDELGRVKYYNKDYIDNNKVYDFDIMKRMGRNFLTKGNTVTTTLLNTNQVVKNGNQFFDYNGTQVYPTNNQQNQFSLNVINEGEFQEGNSALDDMISKERITEESLPPGGIAFTVYYQNNQGRSDDDKMVWGPFLDTTEGKNQRTVLWTMCNSILSKLETEEQNRRELVGTILGNAKEQSNVLYKQFHLLFNQWNLLAYEDSEIIDLSLKNPGVCNPIQQTSGLAKMLELQFGGEEIEGKNTKHINVKGNSDPVLPKNVTFRYDYPMNSIRKDKQDNPVNVADAIVNIEPLYNPKASTTLLNAIQQICQKNNFIFIPIPGNGDYRNISEIYVPNPDVAKTNVRNYFHVLFAPTPERRAFGNKGVTDRNNGGDASDANQLVAEAIVFKFGDMDNKVVKSINVSTDENKITAESIVNLQRLVDNENRNKKITTDCSTLPVLEGRSYKATIEMLGNSQVYPMQYFFIPKMPMFGGLYQIMKVKHSITANDMTTTIEGLKMLFSKNGYGGQEPITLTSLFKKLNIEAPNTEGGSEVNENGE